MFRAIPAAIIALLLLAACARTDITPPASANAESGLSSISGEQPAISEALPEREETYESEPDEPSKAELESEASASTSVSSEGPAAGSQSEGPAAGSQAESRSPAAPESAAAQPAKPAGTGSSAVSRADESAAPDTPAPKTGRAEISEAAAILYIEEELLRLINDDRRENGLEALGVEPDMQLAAGIRAAEALGRLSHTRPDGSPYHTAFDESGFQYAGKWHGENLAALHMSTDAYDEATVAAALFSEWSGSTGHRQNILRESFVQTGIAISIRQSDGVVEIGAAQLFASL